jgi:lysozyme family protein
MARVRLDAALRADYQQLYDRCTVTPARAAQVEALVDRLAAHGARYRAVASVSGVPWPVVAVIHSLEAGQDFRCHLHNGDPLTARTTHVPKGRPVAGTPPFAWEVSAADALSGHGLNAACDWSLPATLYHIEGYNGWGYRLHHPATRTPYLWSFSNLYARGKYVADGSWSNSAVSAQCGAAVLLKRMAARGLAGFQP